MYIILPAPQYIVRIELKDSNGLACEIEKKGGVDKSESVGGGLE